MRCDLPSPGVSRSASACHNRQSGKLSPVTLIARRHLPLLFTGALAARAQQPAAELDWHNAKQFTVEGLGFNDLKSPYDRLPARAEGVVRPAVWDLSRDASGVLVRFVANTPAIHARWTLTKKNLTIPTMTAVASSGLDLYARDDARRWRWLSIGRPTQFPGNTGALASSLPPGPREYMLYLPLRNGVASLEIGVPKGSAIRKGPARPAAAKPIVFYGTSITHGAAASRAGMTHVAQLGRMLNHEVINLGFSGNGKMEPEVTKFIAEINAAAFVLDCLPNMTAAEVRQRAAACVKTLRAAHPTAPILLVEDRNYADSFLNAARRERNETNHAALQEVYVQLQRERIGGLAYLRADHLLGDDGEATIDGSHPTDLGFQRHAAEFARALRPLLP
ncbi:MAG: SGNH/GDSL hydrolase family protein [Bryobacterales bacterium]|nr:SGNH/GDSL hydrolase family protein [Bryobacterales bacterium]